MFNLFKKKDKEVKITDKIIIDEKAKLAALFAAWEADKNTVFVFWFDSTLREAESFFAARTSETITMMMARETAVQHISDRPVLFAEHYPLHSKEEELYEKLKLESVTVYSALAEPLFKRFGADKIIQLMKQLGMKEDELIEHKMISKSIRNAQEKIEKKTVAEQTALSQMDWLEKNLPDE